MFQKILAALDNSPSSRGVFEQALELARQNHAQLMLTHVLTFSEDGFPVPASPMPGEYYVLGDAAYERYWALRDTARQKAVEQLTVLTQEAQEAGVSTEFVVHDTNPERAIRTQAKSWGADLIVMGRRRHSGLGELFMGSVSNYLLHHAHCAVLVLQLEAKTDEPQTPAPAAHVVF